ncbi:MAG TPA: hypothetical protein PKD24_10440 [Pyrinomonadaceae bacterium]|nr:hypothetical protein [Pyrinomonadaceae bacterium]HMP65343.1 hypothetical protein [Pyrinomonadaceae bacterium]
MYCSGCGSQIQQGLNYCNRCGKRINDERPVSQGISPDVAKAVGYIGGFGFFAYIFVVFIFLRAGAPTNQLVPISFFFFAALFGICLMLLHYGKGLTIKKGDQQVLSTSDAEVPRYIEPTATHRLSEPAEAGFQSVTEHTTRTLDEVPIEKK